MEIARDTHSFAVPPYMRNVKHCEQVPRNEYARYELRVASDACGVTGECLMTVAQSARLLRWVIAGLILLGVLLYFFGPAALRSDEVIIIGLMIVALIWLQVRLHQHSA
jgi:hypothetical protein